MLLPEDSSEEESESLLSSLTFACSQGTLPLDVGFSSPSRDRILVTIVMVTVAFAMEIVCRNDFASPEIIRDRTSDPVFSFEFGPSFPC